MDIEDVRALSEQLYLSHLPDIQERQKAFFEGYGQYFQGLPTHSQENMPGIDYNGQETAPDKIGEGNYPTDQPIPWPADDFPKSMICAFQINTYQSSVGKYGYQCVLIFIYDEQINMKGYNHGPDDNYSYPWVTIGE